MRSIIYYNDSLAELHDMDLLISSGDVKPSLLSFPALVATIFYCSLPSKVYQGAKVLSNASTQARAVFQTSAEVHLAVSRYPSKAGSLKITGEWAA